MKYNTTYTPKMELKETVRAVDFLKSNILKKLFKRFNPITLDAPVYADEDSELIVKMENVTRHVTFDFGSEYRGATMYLSHTNWLRQQIYRMNLKPNEAVFTENKYVWRDVEDTPVNNYQRNEMILQFIADKNIDPNKFIRDLTQDIYEAIYGLNILVNEKYDIKNIYPDFAPFISSQQMENELPDENFHQREIDNIMENNAFIFESPGYTLNSGKTHIHIPPTLYDLKNMYQIMLKDSINSEVLKVASVSVLASGVQLVDQLQLHGMGSMIQSKFYSDLSKREDKIIEIKLNIPRIMMAVLNKGHIGEVQAGVHSDESKVISEKYKVNII